MWIMGMLLTNAFIVYKRFHELHKSKPKYNHYEFVCKIAKAWLQPEHHCFIKKKRANRKSRDDDETTITEINTTSTTSTGGRGTIRSRRSTSTTTTTAITTTVEPIIKKRKMGMLDATINTKFRSRLNIDLPHGQFQLPFRKI